jgi:hypothetical protein
VGAAYAALSRLVLQGELAALAGCFWYFSTPLVVIAGLIVAQRRMREPL